MIEKIGHYSLTNPASVYDEEALTALELAGRTAAKVNEAVGAFNTLEKETGDHLQAQDKEIADRTEAQDKEIADRMEAQDNRITKMNDETMPEKVTSEVGKQIQNGTFDRQINEYIGNLEERVDTLLGSVSEGSTTLDAEVIDMRTDILGKTHESAGRAIREHFQYLGKIITDIQYIEDMFIDGSGKEVSIANFKCTDYIDISKYSGQTLVLLSSLLQYAGFAIYDETKRCIAGVTGVNSGSDNYHDYFRFTLPIEAYYLRFSLYTSRLTEGKVLIYPSYTSASDIKKMITDDTYISVDISDLSYQSNNAINAYNGVATEGSGDGFPLLSSDYVDITGYELADLHLRAVFNGWAGMAFYDSNKNYIAGESAESLGVVVSYPVNVIISIPKNACFIRFTGNRDYEGYTVNIKENVRNLVNSIPVVGTTEKTAYEYAVEKILCIGDSLTSGACYVNEWTGESIDQNYPRYLSRMLNCEVTNAGKSGWSASNWYHAYINTYDFASYDTFIIWLGTNYGCDAMPTEAEINAFTPDTSEGADTANQALYLIEIIKTIQTANPDAYILLANCFASKSDVSANNEVITTIAENYGCVLLDMSDMGASDKPELHGGISNPHFGKAGNIFIANRICNRINEDLTEDPLRAEFGYTARTN